MCSLPGVTVSNHQNHGDFKEEKFILSWHWEPEIQTQAVCELFASKGRIYHCLLYFGLASGIQLLVLKALKDIPPPFIVWACRWDSWML